MQISKKGILYRIRWFWADKRCVPAQESLCEFCRKLLLNLFLGIPLGAAFIALVAVLIVSWELTWTGLGLLFGYRALFIWEEERHSDVGWHMENDPELPGMTWRRIPWWPLKGVWRILPVTVTALYFVAPPILGLCISAGSALIKVVSSPVTGWLTLFVVLALLLSVTAVKAMRAFRKSELHALIGERVDAWKKGFCPTITFVDPKSA